ncbi:hypothetical protein BHE74_00058353 [Ensete ventricosum]|nr:hypothetical protein BHE74_00058353 [Ensete ventricosum]
MRLWQREEGEEGTAEGDCGSKGGWLQPSVARRGGRMGDGDAIEGWKAVATREEEAGVNGGWQRWLLTGVGGYGRWLAAIVDGLRQRKTEEEQRAASLSAIAERWSRSSGWTGLVAEVAVACMGRMGKDSDGRWEEVAGTSTYRAAAAAGDMVVGDSSREERNRGLAGGEEEAGAGGRREEAVAVVGEGCGCDCGYSFLEEEARATVEEEVATAATAEEARCRHCTGGRLWLRGKMVATGRG